VAVGWMSLVVAAASMELNNNNNDNKNNKVINAFDVWKSIIL